MAGTLLRGATVITMDPRRPRAAAVGLEGDAILAVGSEDEVRARLGDGAEVVDLGGGALLPGFIDAHHHYCLAAFDRGSPDLHLPPGSSIADLLALLGDAVRVKPEGWVRAQGYDPAKLRERRPPRREELDELCPDRPLLALAYSFHDGVLNSRGLAELGFGPGSPDPPNGLLGRDRRGRLTGEVCEQAFFLAEAHSRNALLGSASDAWAAECEAHGERLLAAGITRVGDAAVPPAFEGLYEQADRDGRLPLTVHRMPVAAASLIEPRLAGEPTGGGGGRVPVGPAKLFADGAERCAVCMSARQLAEVAAGTLRSVAGGAGLAALRASLRVGRLRRGPDGRFHRGMRFWEQERLDAAVAEAGERGFQVAQHAIGNEAVASALTAIERAGARLDAPPGRPRLEHAMLLGPALVRRIAATGAIAVVQPHLVRDLGDDLMLVPLPRSIRALPLRSLEAAGAVLAGSSDYPVSGFDVLAAVQAAATRRTRAGGLLEAGEALDPGAALRAYTAGAAAALGVEGEAGSIEPGKRADLVQLGADPLATDPDRIGAIAVRRTWVGGRLAHTAPAPAAAAPPGG